MSQVHGLTCHELLQGYRAGSWSVDEVLSSLSKRIIERNPSLNAYLEFSKETSRRLANLDPAKAPLWGVPIAIKDNICVESWPSTCASKVLKGHVAAYDATAVERLLSAGAIVYGRTNMDEFAFGSSCETSCYGPTKNPWDTSRVPGGSSGGSAAAVAADIAYAALGSDTGGSIRQPASLCSVVGFKPTYGRISRFGLIAFASSLDQIGPFTKDVRDSALLLNALCAHDPKDSTSADIASEDFTRYLGKSIQGLRIGLPKEYFSAGGLSPAVDKALEEAKKQFEKLGAIFEEVSLPHTRYAVSVYYIVAPSEASSNLARFDGVRYGHRSSEADTLQAMFERTRAEGFGAEVKRRVILGTFSLSSGYYDAYYLRAMKVRTRIKQDFDQAFKKVDMILTPTSPTTAFKIGEKNTDPLQMYLSDIYTISANLAGIPGVSLPCGFESRDSVKLPIGMQLLGRPFDEARMLQCAHAFEQSTFFHKQKPDMTVGLSKTVSA